VHDDPPTRTPHDREWYLSHLAADAQRFASALDAGPLDAPVAACGDWDVARLAEHLGQIHRWAAFCAREGRGPSSEEAAALESFERDRAADWYRSCVDELVGVLGEVDPAAPTWHPFPTEQVASFWPRRQAHETALHRWDAERAIGLDPVVDAELASDGIDEYFEAIVPRLIVREKVSVPASSFHVHCTDVDGEWLVWSDDGEYRMIRAHQKGDAALRGPAAAILLRLWGRAPDGDDELSPVGDEAALAAWTSLGGA